MKNKCPRCDKKTDSKFDFCPYCGSLIKTGKKNDDFGLLGKAESMPNFQNQMKLPMGMEKIMGPLIKQLEKQIGSMNLQGPDGTPRGIKIQIAKAPHNIQTPMKQNSIHQKVEIKVSEKEMKRRLSLPKISAESKVKRLNDNIIYEMETPGVKKREDVAITELATGFEIKAYSSDKCYVKFIPIKTEQIDYYVEKDRVSIELKS